MICTVCGPQPAPIVHTICHPHPETFKRQGCGDPVADHSDGMRCRVCKTECGIDCTPPPRRPANELTLDYDQRGHELVDTRERL